MGRERGKGSCGAAVLKFGRVRIIMGSAWSTSAMEYAHSTRSTSAVSLNPSPPPPFVAWGEVRWVGCGVRWVGWCVVWQGREV